MLWATRERREEREKLRRISKFSLKTSFQATCLKSWICNKNIFKLSQKISQLNLGHPELIYFHFLNTTPTVPWWLHCRVLSSEKVFYLNLLPFHYFSHLFSVQVRWLCVGVDNIPQHQQLHHQQCHHKHNHGIRELWLWWEILQHSVSCNSGHHDQGWGGCSLWEVLHGLVQVKTTHNNLSYESSEGRVHLLTLIPDCRILTPIR